MMKLTKELAEKGWVIRPSTENSAEILVRGARKQDSAFDYKHGFVYAESVKEAKDYDKKYQY